MYPEKLTEALARFLGVPTADPRLLPSAEELMESLRSVALESECLRRYAEIAQRMGPPKKYSFVPPNFPYTLHSV